jgi:glycosyltransferase involved in cell wall biosynthesis
MTGVIHVVTSLERGGAQRNTLETAARLHDEGRPQLLVTGAPGELDDEAARRLGTRFIRLPDLRNPVDPVRDTLALLTLQRLIDREVDRLGSPVVVHTHSSKAGVIGRLAARSVRGVVVVHTVHGFGLEALGQRRRWILEAAERVAGPAADVMIFVSDADRARADELGLLRGVRAETIRSGVDDKPFLALRDDVERRARARAALGVPAASPLVVTVGNLKPQKDPLFHVEILAALRRERPDARLVLLGDGPLRAEVEARAHARGVSAALTLPGFVDDTRDALAAADAFLLASAWEGLPRALLEATAAGLPCVVRDTGWAADVAWAKNVVAIGDGAPADVFAAALDDVIGSKRARKAPKLPRAFTLDGMLRQLEELYDELIGPPRPTGAMLRRRPVRPRPRDRRRR